VHLMNRYCMRIRKMLNDELGDGYEEWECL
jgi:hypothetical protein